jgi:hypothetical protein
MRTGFVVAFGATLAIGLIIGFVQSRRKHVKFIDFSRGRERAARQVNNKASPWRFDRTQLPTRNVALAKRAVRVSLAGWLCGIGLAIVAYSDRGQAGKVPLANAIVALLFAAGFTTLHIWARILVRKSKE